MIVNYVYVLNMWLDIVMFSGVVCSSWFCVCAVLVYVILFSM